MYIYIYIYIYTEKVKFDDTLEYWSITQYKAE